MKNLKFTLVLFILAAINYSCQAPAAGGEDLDMDAIKAEIAAMEEAYAAASNSNDADALVAYYADDAVSLTNNGAPTVGKEAILARTKENMAKDTSGSTASYEVVDAQG